MNALNSKLETRNLKLQDLLQGEIISSEIIDNIFNSLENQLLDRNELLIDFQCVTFISVYFLERLGKLVNKARELNVKIKIVNVQPSVYKVFQVARSKDIVRVCS